MSIIAPRGGAKSVWFTLAYVLRCALEGWEKYILILSDSSQQADEHLSNIRNELENNETILAVYPDVAGPGDQWRGERIRLRNGVVIASLGTGKKVRGRRNKESRPSLIIVDDPQSIEDASSPALRLSAWNWFTREVLPCGNEQTNIVSIGSAIHRESVSVRVGNLVGWTSRNYRAIHSYPTNLELWQKHDLIATNLSDNDRDIHAHEFFLANRAEMEEGCQTFWPEKFTIETLMRTRAEMGNSGFNAEYQGIPGQVEGAEWPSDLFDWDGFIVNEAPTDCILKVQALDPSKGNHARSGDYQAHAFISLAKDGTIYIDCDFRREPSWCQRALEHAAVFRPYELCAESNGTMGLMIPEMNRILAERTTPVYTPNIREIPNSGSKASRIRTVNPYLIAKQIRVKNTPGGRLLIEQWKDFPNGTHDDGPDAVATAIIRLQELYFGTNQ